MQPLAPDEPSHVGPYRLLGRLGAGGMGRVYLARSLSGPQEPVAVKVVRADIAERSEFRRRFVREVAAARRVGGPCTAAVLDADTDAAVPWVATEYVAGPTLRAVVQGEFGALPSASTHVLAHRLASALAAIHAAGLVHRDLKPSNILLTVDGPRVIDFGVAHVLDVPLDSTITPEGMLVGSPEFMAPEQIRGQRVSPASDVFALGCVLTYAATARSPFEAEERGLHALMFRIAYEEPDLTGLPESVSEVVRDCLAKEPGDRPSVEEVLDRTRNAPPGAWLPSSLLERLDRAAAQPLPHTPRRVARSAPEPAGIPVFPEPVGRDLLDVPEAGIAPPRVLAAVAPPRRKAARWAAAAAVAVVAGSLLALLSPWPDASSGGTQDPGSVAGPEPERAVRFTGAWQRGGFMRLEFHVAARPGSEGADFVVGSPEAVCRGEARTARLSQDDRSLVLGGYRLTSTVPEGSSWKQCGLPSRITLWREGEFILWDVPGSRGQVMDPAAPSATTVEEYRGTWQSADGRTLVVRGTAIGDAAIRMTGTERGRPCAYRARAVDVAQEPTVLGRLGLLTTHAVPDRAEGCGRDAGTYAYTFEDGDPGDGAALVRTGDDDEPVVEFRKVR
ncbi:serine/threonine-protein kinase [Streptomyces sp. NPDC048211]|uniref:serine/threonine-protein kinase n=1 Tax=Streptomyces sp. NPDC048211 TaxID=3365516 RepID=UPI003724500B